MSILSLGLTTVPNYLTYPAHESVRQYLLRDLEMSATRLGITTPPTQPGGEWDLLARMCATATDVNFSSLQLSNAKADPVYAEGDDLDTIRQRLGLPELPATGGAGNVTVTVTGPATFLAGEEATFPGGLRGAVSTDTVFAVAGTGPVPVAMIDAGAVTNFVTGTTCRWASPPVNAFTVATVAADFEGGSDAETDADKRLRILDALQLPQTYGSPQWILSQVAAFPAGDYPGSSVPDQAFCYRAPGGPGTFLIVVMQTGTVANGGSRAVSATTLAGLRTYLSGLVPPEVHFDVRTAVEVTNNVSLDVAFSGVRGATNWADATPWPTLQSFQSFVQFTGTSGGDTLTGVQCYTAPPLGAHVTVTTDAGGRFDHTIIAIGGISGNYQIQLSPALDPAEVSGWVYPTITSIGTAVEDLWFAAMGELACGELTTDTRLPQCRRFPSIALGGAPSGTLGAVRNLMTSLGSAVVDVDLRYNASTAPTASIAVSDSPNVLVPHRFACYPLAYS